jgi:hypothetical protein
MVRQAHHEWRQAAKLTVPRERERSTCFQASTLSRSQSKLRFAIDARESGCEHPGYSDAAYARSVAVRDL